MVDATPSVQQDGPQVTAGKLAAIDAQARIDAIRAARKAAAAS